MGGKIIFIMSCVHMFIEGVKEEEKNILYIAMYCNMFVGVGEWDVGTFTSGGELLYCIV